MLHIRRKLGSSNKAKDSVYSESIMRLEHSYFLNRYFSLRTMQIEEENSDLTSQKQNSNFFSHEIPAGIYEVRDKSNFSGIFKKQMFL